VRSAADLARVVPVSSDKNQMRNSKHLPLALMQHHASILKRPGCHDEKLKKDVSELNLPLLGFKPITYLM